MKRLTLLSTTLTIIVWSLCADNVTNGAHGLSIQPYTSTYKYQTSAPVNIQTESFSLFADSGSLQHDIAIQLSVIPRKGGTLMPSNMENVCWLSDGVQLLPGGVHFSEDNPVLISLAYDPDRLPMGYKPKEVYTYYCDDARSWHRLERVSVDTIRHMIISYTTHFTDFANAVIKVPEMPESKAFVPTQMTDLPDVNPMQGIPMIEVPTPNNRGTAELTYPIEIPKGRQGLQPNVDLHYSSAGGNGILGVGWSLNTPAITLDTRWGAPRYDPNYETEQYMVNGAAVLQRETNGTAKALPYQTNSYQPRATGAVRFYARDTKNADKIVRYGNSPTNYWWAVTDRNGVTTYYGRRFNPNNPYDQTIDENSVVRAHNSCIAYWAATATVDVFGNFILYDNEKVGENIYVRNIDYTGNIPQQALPTYRVHLSYTDRVDKYTNGRLGVLQTEGRLLCNVLVQYLNRQNPTAPYADNLAAYYMQYTDPSETTLYKSRLAEVVMLDSVHDLILDDVCEFHMVDGGYVSHNQLWYELVQLAESTHNTQLYEQLHSTYGEYSIPASRTSFSYANAPTTDSLYLTQKTLSNSGGKDLSNSRSSSWSIGGTATVGVGPDIFTTILSGGGNYDYSRSQGECKTMLLDLNGDGLTDIVYEEDGTVYYKKQYKSGNSYGFSNAVQIQGLTRLSREISDTHTWGVQLSLGANLSYSHPTTTTYTDTYFSDVNADGLPDMIDGDVIRINHLENGVPSFTIHTGVETQTITVHNSHCEKSIILDGEVDEHIECDLVEVLVGSYTLDDFFGSESTYDLEVELVEDKLEEAPPMLHHEGGIVNGQDHNTVIDEIGEVIGKTPELPPPPTPPVPKSAKQAVRSGSIIPNDSLIYRIEGNRVKVYRLEYVCYPVNRDPAIETVRVWVAPKAGDILVSDTIALLADSSASRLHSVTADGVTYSIQLCDSVTMQDSLHLHALYHSLLKKSTIDADDYTTHTWDSMVHVKKGDVLMFRLRSGKNNLFDKTRWRHIIHYNNEAEIYDSDKDFICTGDGYFMAAKNGTALLSFSGRNEDTLSVRLRVQKGIQLPYLLDTVLQPGVFNIPSRMLSPVIANDSIFIRLEPNTPIEPCWSKIHLSPEIQLMADFETGNSAVPTKHDTITYYPDVQIQCSSINLNQSTSTYRTLFGPLHKGWGVFAHQDVHGQNMIILDSLVNTQQLAINYARNHTSAFYNNPSVSSFSPDANSSNWDSQVNTIVENENVFNPIATNSYWVPMRADSRTEQWIAYGDLGCIGKRIHSNARELKVVENVVEDIVEYDSSLPFSQGEVRKNNFVRKQTRSSQSSISYGAMLVPINSSKSSGSYESIVDYMDMNGDGYPDFVGKGGIQYSTPWGGIGKLEAVNNFTPFMSTNNSNGSSFSACPIQLYKTPGNNTRDGKFSISASFGGSLGSGESSTKISYMDVNADGLPDKVDVINQKVRYNLGYGFSDEYGFAVYINEGENSSVSLNASIPFSLGQVSISGGLGGSMSTDNSEHMLADINGDGLPDRIWKNGSRVEVAYNKGINSNGILFDDWKDLPNAISNISQNNTENVSTTLGITGGFSILGIVKVNIGVQSSPYGTSTSKGEIMFTDMNGDGLTDYVWKNNNQLYVRHNAIGKANLLTSVTNPTGQVIQLTYHLSEPSVEHRSRQWEMIRVDDIAPHHPMQDAQMSYMDILYDSAYYDNYEKTDYGYSNVITTINDEKRKIEHYHNSSLLLNGELIEDWLLDHHNDNKYIHHIHGSRYLDLDTHESTENGASLCNDANARIEQDGYWTEYYEGENSSQITTHYDIVYDQYHNMVQYLDHGDVTTPDDDWQQQIIYLSNSANNMVSLPSEEYVYDGGHNFLRASYVHYDQKGKPADIHFLDVNQNEDATTYLHYDNYGNIESVILPTDANNENNWASFAYDPVTHSHVVSIDNPFSVHSYTDYDYRWGLPIRTIDPAGDTIEYAYDYKGRLEKVIAPFELRLKKDYTVKYTYNLINHNLVSHVPYNFTHVFKDMYDSLFVQKEISLYDERGKMIQKKHVAELYGQNYWLVDKAEEWDAFGRVLTQGFPFKINGNLDEYEPISSASAVVQTTYDVMDRPLLQTNADNTTKLFYYGFGNDLTHVKRFITAIEDENSIMTVTLKSPQDWLIQQVAGDGSITFYEYSPIGELLHVTDAEGYRTSYIYDMLGRMLSRSHPDAGLTTMTYDLAGNMLTKQTANLRSSNEEIQYVYKYSRLMGIRYPRHTADSVTYLYDQAGRVAIRKDGTGLEGFVYDQLGNVVQSTRRIIIPTENNAYMFRTRYRYDSFGRMRNIIYPDGEVVYYGYTTGGLLKNIMGQKSGQDALYLWDRTYDEQGRKVYQLDGNGVWTTYGYDPARQWLKQIHTELPSGTVLEDKGIIYDHVGNVDQIEQTASALSGPVTGGGYKNTYTYDAQYRLATSSGIGSFPYSFNAVYSPSGRMGNKITSSSATNLWFGYDEDHYTHQPRTVYDYLVGSMSFYWDNNGNLAQIIGCNANKVRFHEWDEENRLRFVLGDKYAGYYGYDGNGERVYKLTGDASFSQINSGTLHAQAVFDNGAIYPNPYMVITPKYYTKHYYAGTERLATVIGSGGFADVISPEDVISTQEDYIADFFFTNYEHQNEDPFHYENAISEPVETEDIYGQQDYKLNYDCDPIELEAIDILAKQDIFGYVVHENQYSNNQETDRFFYHGDHLGSATWITDAQATPVQYIHYAPYGELIANQMSDWYDERYKFTGKERDYESGYDAFGARYLSSVFGHWLSVDPLVDKYLWISPYAYAAWNPIKNKDPNGMWVETAWDIANVAMDISSLKSNISTGNVGGAVVDGMGLMLDLGATILPAVPGGAGMALKAYRTADKVGDASKIGKAIDKVEKTFQTYIKRNPKTGEVYVGRTSGTRSPKQNVKARDSQHHKNADGFGPAEIVNSSTSKDAIRGQEQRLIEQYGGAKSSGGTSGNAINGVSPNNPNAEKYIKAAKTEFGEL